MPLTTLYNLDNLKNSYAAAEDKIIEFVREKKLAAMQKIMPIDIQEQKLIRKAQILRVLIELLEQQIGAIDFNRDSLIVEYQKRIDECIEKVIVASYSDRLTTRVEIFENDSFIKLTPEIRSTLLVRFRDDLLVEVREYETFPAEITAENLLSILEELQQKDTTLRAKIDELAAEKSKLGMYLYHQPIDEARKRKQALHKDKERRIEEINSEGINRLSSACEKGDLASVQACVEEIPASTRAEYLNQLDYNDRCPLHVACLHGQSAIVRYLLSVGASIQQVDARGDLPIHYAALNAKESAVAILRILRTNGASIDALGRNDQTILHLSSTHNNLHVVQWLLNLPEGKALIDRQTNERLYKRTALHIAAASGFISIVSCLLEHGANHNILNIAMETPLTEAIIANHTEVIQIFLRSGIWLNIKQREILQQQKDYNSRLQPLLIRVLREDINAFETMPTAPLAIVRETSSAPVLLSASAIAAGSTASAASVVGNEDQNVGDKTLCP